MSSGAGDLPEKPQVSLYRIARATALPADAIDASQTSENAGGVNPDPTPTVKEFSIAEYTAAVAAGNLPDAYALNDTAANLAGATYAAVTGASSITLEDNLTDLFKADGTLSAAATTAAGLATKVVVADSLNNLLSVTLPTGGIGGKPTSLLVTGKVNPKVVLDDISVAKAATAQADLDAFLARTDVAYDADSGAKKPDALTLSSYSITDSAAAIAAANADAAQKALLTAADEVNISDTMAGISAVPVDTFNLISLGKAAGRITVADSLANFSDANPSVTILKALVGAGATFDVTDTGDVADVDIAGLLNFKPVSGQTGTGAKIVLDADVTSVSLTAEAMKEAASGNTLDVKLDDMFDTASFTGTINLTGSNFADTITASKVGGIIDGNGGADKITLGDATDTVVLGTVLDKASAKGDNSANVAEIVNFGTADGSDDIIDFGGDLNGFGSEGFVVTAAAVIKQQQFSAGANLNGKNIIFFSGAMDAGSSVSNYVNDDVTEDFILIAGENSGSDTKIWYVDGNGAAASTFTLVATLTGITVSADALAASNFTAANFDPFA